MAAVAMLFVLTLAVQDIFAKGPYRNDFNNTYGTGGTQLDSCGVCHYNFGGGGTLNSYGLAFLGSGHNFGAIEGTDSDGDGFSNGHEITVSFTMPGLACEDLGSTTGAPGDLADYVDPSNPGCSSALDIVYVDFATGSPAGSGVEGDIGTAKRYMPKHFDCFNRG